MADVLVFGAHPDDAEFGMGASLVKLSKELSIAICVLTNGEAGTYGNEELRIKEARAAAEEINASIEFLGLKDCSVTDNFQDRLRIASVIRKHKPLILFAPHPSSQGSYEDGRAHPDHSATGLLVKAAARYARFKNLKGVKGDPWKVKHLFYYMVPNAEKPDFYLDVSDSVDEWEAVARKHNSQTALKQGKVLEWLRTVRRMNGARVGVEYAEAFASDKALVLSFEKGFKVL